MIAFKKKKKKKKYKWTVLFSYTSKNALKYWSNKNLTQLKS